jgi:hypothetical protein
MASPKTPKPDVRTINRDARTGRMVTDQYVRQHPSTTTTEHRPTSGGKKPGKK